MMKGHMSLVQKPLFKLSVFFYAPEGTSVAY